MGGIARAFVYGAAGTAGGALVLAAGAIIGGHVVRVALRRACRDAWAQGVARVWKIYQPEEK
jgi:hypothetical protein